MLSKLECQGFCFGILFLVIIATGGFIIVLVIQELYQHLLNVIQSRLLSSESLLLSLYTLMEIIIMVIVGHISQHSPYLL